mmetsp:Transcript_13144/g.16249  ORF Transcript_13144/g.16249 Transcript_13144/m.16249 type:complete len:201 (-) Transcript_13144:1529-2131(-)
MADILAKNESALKKRRLLKGEKRFKILRLLRISILDAIDIFAKLRVNYIIEQMTALRLHSREQIVTINAGQHLVKERTGVPLRKLAHIKVDQHKKTTQGIILSGGILSGRLKRGDLNNVPTHNAGGIEVVGQKSFDLPQRFLVVAKLRTNSVHNSVCSKTDFVGHGGIKTTIIALHVMIRERRQVVHEFIYIGRVHVNAN